MATTEESVELQGEWDRREREPEERRASASARFDWLFAVLSVWFVGGVTLDGWAHNHLPNLETFFTPWHAVLYSGALAVILCLPAVWFYNRRKGCAWYRALPPGYEFSALGAVIFLIGAIGDMFWHILFGIEVNLEALLSPTHLLLALGGFLLAGGPLRSAWLRYRAYVVRRSALLPALISVACLFGVLTFFTQYANPFDDTYAAHNYGADFTKSNSDLYLISADGNRVTRLSNDQANYVSPQWSSDGKMELFSSGPLGQ